MGKGRFRGDGEQRIGDLGEFIPWANVHETLWRNACDAHPRVREKDVYFVYNVYSVLMRAYKPIHLYTGMYTE